MRSFLLLAVAGVTVLAGCSASVVEPSPVSGAPPLSRHPERRGIGLLPIGERQAMAEPKREVSVDPRRSLAVTDEVILARFSFEEVMNQLVEQSRIRGLTALRLYQEW